MTDLRVAWRLSNDSSYVKNLFAMLTRSKADTRARLGLDNVQVIDMPNLNRGAKSLGENSETDPDVPNRETRSEYQDRRLWYQNKVNGDRLSSAKEGNQIRSRKKQGEIEDDDAAVYEEYRNRRLWYKERTENAESETLINPISIIAAVREELDLEGLTSLFLLLACTIMGLSTWFSAGAVLPQLQKRWEIDDDMASFLTIMVNLGKPLLITMLGI